jgi:hypothetical protein
MYSQNLLLPEIIHDDMMTQCGCCLTKIHSLPLTLPNTQQCFEPGNGFQFKFLHQGKTSRLKFKQHSRTESRVHVQSQHSQTLFRVQSQHSQTHFRVQSQHSQTLFRVHSQYSRTGSHVHLQHSQHHVMYTEDDMPKLSELLPFS